MLSAGFGLLAFSGFVRCLGAQQGEPVIHRIDGGAVTVDAGIPVYSPAPPLTGDLDIVGGGGGPGNPRELVGLWVDIFRRAHPLVQVRSAIYAAGIAAPALQEAGTSPEINEVGIICREFMPYENQMFRNREYKPVLVPVAGGAYARRGATCALIVFVNKDNPLEKLTLDQVDAIFSKTRKRGYREDITRWGQVGLTGEWADKAINIYGLDMPDGIAFAFEKLALAEGEFKDSLRQQATTPDMNATFKVTRRVAEDRFGIGYAGLDNSRPETKVVALAETEAGPYSAASFEDVLNNRYPLNRSIYLAILRYPGKPLNPLAKEFIRVALSKEGQTAVARTIYMPMSARAVEKSSSQIGQ